MPDSPRIPPQLTEGTRAPRRSVRLWLLFAQSVTVFLALLFVGALVDSKLLGSLGTDSVSTSLASPATFRLAMQRVVPSVVSVRAAGANSDDDEPQFAPGFSLGSGVIVSSDGYIITNAHVIRDAPTIIIETDDGAQHTASIVGSDPLIDIAVLRIYPSAPLRPVRFAGSQEVAVGDLVVSVGSPFGLPGTATMGIVSAVGRSGLGLARFEHFIQTDAAINHGSSGGALANSSGELVGISTALFAKQLQGTYAQGIGFAIPAGLAQVAYEQIVEHGRFRRGWIGIDYSPIVSADDDSIGQVRMLITDVAENSPAAQAGLQAGDYVLTFNDRAPELIGRLDEALGLLMQPGDVVRLVVERQGRTFEVEMEAIDSDEAKS